MGNSEPKGPIRVAMLGAFPPQCQGIQEYCRTIAEALSDQSRIHAIGFKKMYPALLFPGVKRAMDPEKPPMRGKMLSVEHRLTWYNPLGWLRAGLFAPADVFHLQWWSLPLLPVALTLVACMKLRGKPVVVTVHNVLPHEGGRALALAGRLLCLWADAVIVHGEANRQALVAHYGIEAERVRALPMPVQAWPIPLPSREIARRSLDLPVDALVVLCFGIVRPYKGIDILLRALALLAKDVPRLRLLIAGRLWCDWTPYRGIILAEGLEGRLKTLLDYVSDAQAAACFAAADVAVLPYTHFDAQSAVGAKYLAHGLPLFVSGVGGLPEWVDHDPEWVVAPGDAEAWAKALGGFLGDVEARSRSFEEVAHRVRKRCHPSAVAEAHQLLYRALTARKRGYDGEA